MILFHEKDCIVQIPFGKRALCTKMATDETADKDRRAYKVPIPGNKSVVVTYGGLTDLRQERRMPDGELTILSPLRP